LQKNQDCVIIIISGWERREIFEKTAKQKSFQKSSSIANRRYTCRSNDDNQPVAWYYQETSKLVKPRREPLGFRLS